MKNSETPNPKVSIVIPVYNGSNYLKEAIDSALAQTYKNIEVIVVNDGSNDNGATEKIAKSYGDKIRYYKKDNGGVATALNLGIEKMTGEYFSWLSHDDMYTRRKIKLQIEQLMRDRSKYSIIACNTKTLLDSGIKKRSRIDVRTFAYIDIFLATSATVGLNGCSLLIPKVAFKEVGLFDNSLLYTQDYDLWYRMQKKYNFGLLEKPLVISRAHAEQDSIRNPERMIEAGDELHAKFLNSIPYGRFEKYFSDHRQNIKHAYENYKVYKTRSYKETSSAILKLLLRFYSENDRDEFYRIYSTEIVSSEVNKRIGDSQLQSLHNKIDQEYRMLINSGAKLLPIKYSLQQTHDVMPSKTARFIGSVQNDGLILSGEKIVRKLHSKFFRK